MRKKEKTWSDNRVGEKLTVLTFIYIYIYIWGIWLGVHGCVC